MITRARLQKLYWYNKRTGEFVRIYSRYRPDLIGLVAGSISVDGYRRIRIENKNYLAHRLAWLYVTGKWCREIDHKNGDRGDNRWSNLRASTRGLNRANSRIGRNNALGVKGVRLFRNGKFQARAKQKHLGYFDTAKEAHAAYVAAAKKHFGEFARAR